jgi:glycosyltransferase involved in cell wall biosynthesis
LRSAVGVTHFIADSRYVAKQVRQLYKQDCDVLYPPVDVDRFTLEEKKDDHYVTASRLVPYKKIDLVVKAFARMPDRKLVVVGDGPERERVEQAAEGHSNIRVVGYQSDDSLRRYIAKARAFVFAAIEDFGIAPLEAQACGTPVIALAKGGSLETVVGYGPGPLTGVFFEAQTEDAIVAAVRHFETIESKITPQACRANAERFATDLCRSRLLERTQEILSS